MVGRTDGLVVRYTDLKLLHSLLRRGQGMVVGICRIPAEDLVRLLNRRQREQGVKDFL